MFWKHEKVAQYKDPEVDLIILGDTDKFAQRELFLTIPQVCLRWQKGTKDDRQDVSSDSDWHL